MAAWIGSVVILISVVAGRIVPSFTRNWLAKRGAPNLPSSHGMVDRLALGVLHLGLLGWAFDLEARYVGAFLLLGAALICGGCCAGAAVPRVRNRYFWFCTSVMAGW